MDAPEPYTGAWYRQQFGGINHRLNQQANEQLDRHKATTALQERIETLEARDAEHVVKIGELMEKIDAMGERLDKAAVVVAGLAKKNGAAT